MTSSDVVDAVGSRSEALVTSRTVKRILNQAGIPWGGPSGWPLKEAEAEACAAGRLLKWKKNIAISNSMVAWSLPGREAEAAAAGWQRV